MIWIAIAFIVWILIRAGEKQLKLEMIERELQARRELEDLQNRQIHYQPPRDVYYTVVDSKSNNKQPVLRIERKRVK